MNRKTISLEGEPNFLKELIQNRISDRMIHKISNDSNSSFTIYFETGEKLEKEISKPSIIIRPWNEKITPFNLEKCIELHVRDLLCIDPEGKWGPSDIFEWIKCLDSGSPIFLEKYPIRYWTSKHDVISLIETLIELPKIPTLITEVCGRRPWIANDIFSELKMLWRRVDNSKTNKIDIVDLEVKDIPNTNINNNSNSPNLFELHNLLKLQNGKGWITSTPIRISLMECLEEIIE